MEIAGQDAELPEIRVRTQLFAVFALLAFAGLGVRLFYLQIVEGDNFYRETSERIVKTVTLPAVRGEIRDRRNRPLATTRPSYNVVVNPAQLSHEGYARLLAGLGPLAEGLPDWTKVQEDGRKARDGSLLLAEDIPRDAMAAIETTQDNPGVRIVAVPRRHYPNGPLAAHALGYMNEVSADEVRTRQDEGYRAGDLIGRAGLERQWESYLRGQRGFERLVMDRRGLRRADVHLSDLVEGPTKQLPVAGNNVILTIDVDVQRIAERALRGKLAAAAVVLEVDTGRILALVSKPGFDPNMMSGRLSSEAESRITSNRLRPFVDKALSETYNPGSTFKVITALAALEEGLITADDRTKCYGFLQVGRRRFRCTKSHGLIGLTGAITQSCNVFFYELGARPGMMNRLAKFATELGLGAPSGLGLNSDQSGFVPTEEWHRAQQTADPKNEGFVVGHALNTSIGEGATRATVIQMALLYTAIANGGKLWLPQMVGRIESPAGQVVEEFPPRTRREVSLSAESLATLRRGLVGVVNDPKGTAYKARSKRFLVAGKTGTAQVQRGARHKGDDPPLPYEQIDHAWFAGFAPADHPRIAFAVIVEHGGHGGDVAAPVAMEIVDSYFDDPALAQATGTH